MTAPEAAGHLTLRQIVAGGIHHLAGIELPARERPNQPQVLCRLAGLSRCFDIVVTAAALKRTRQSRLRKSHFRFVAPAATTPLRLLRLPADREQQPAGRPSAAPTRPVVRGSSHLKHMVLTAQ